MAKAALTIRTFFHLIDLRELITLLKGSSGKPDFLDFNLMQRVKIFARAAAFTFGPA